MVEKEAQAEIDRLTRDLAKYAAMNPPESSFDTSSNINSTTEADEATQTDTRKESQALRAAVLRKKETVEVDSDAMEEEENGSIELGTSPLEDNHSDLSSNEESSKDKEIIVVNSSFSTDSSGCSSNHDSHRSINTQELANRLIPHIFNPTTEHLAQTDELSVSSKDLADPQDIGYKSGSRRAHPPSEDPQGTAGDLTEAAGHSV
jgi:hypothetical protein